MAAGLQELQRFLRELKRRNVYKVAVTYLAVAFVGLQTVDLLIPATTLPGWADELILAFLIVGFPISLVVAWAFEMTPEGVRRTSPAEPDGRETGGVGAEPEGEPEEFASASLAYKLLVGLGLVAGVVAGGWYLTGAGGGGGSVTDRSLAVLPFETLGAQEASAFTDGVHSDLLIRLSEVSDFRVISRTSVMRYRSPESSLPRIAEELGVTWVLRGEVQESGGRVRVRVRLVNARDDELVWAESYTRELTAENLFSIQEEITRRIVQELEARLTPEEIRQLETTPTEDLDAYRLYVRGRSFLDQQTEKGMREAAVWFRRAIARDSSYAFAWAGLADALMFLSEYGYTPADSVLPEARRAVRRALDLDPTSAEAHVSRAFLHAARGDGPGLVRELLRGVELRPSYAQAHTLLGWYYPLLGHSRDGLEAARRAVELDPFSPEARVNFALGLLRERRLDSALVSARRARELQDDYSTAPFYEAVTLFHLGRREEAKSLLRGLEVEWAPSAPATVLALAEMSSGDGSRARALLRRLQEGTAEGRGKEALFYQGLLRAALGERDAAFDAFGQIDGWGESPLLAWPNVSLRYLFTDILGPLRDDPRYDELLSRINRDWGLDPDGSGLPGLTQR